VRDFFCISVVLLFQLFGFPRWLMSRPSVDHGELGLHLVGQWTYSHNDSCAFKVKHSLVLYRLLSYSSLVSTGLLCSSASLPRSTVSQYLRRRSAKALSSCGSLGQPKALCWLCISASARSQLLSSSHLRQRLLLSASLVLSIPLATFRASY
jgi:hypothetical protein